MAEQALRTISHWKAKYEMPMMHLRVAASLVSLMVFLASSRRSVQIKNSQSVSAS